MHGLTFVHHPLNSVGHNVKKDEQIEEKWEKFFSYGKDERSFDKLDYSQIQIIDIDKNSFLANFLHFFRLISNRPLLYKKKYFHEYGDVFPNEYHKIKKNLLDKYYNSGKEHLPLHKAPGKITLAVHLRRGDVTNADYPDRYTNNEKIKQTLIFIKNITTQLGWELNIDGYSQGSPKEFSDLKDIVDTFYLDYDVFATFHNLVEADILVMAKSSFSYSAALLSQGIVLYEPFWHSHLNDWVVIKEDGNFDHIQFKNKLSRHKHFKITNS